MLKIIECDFVTEKHCEDYLYLLDQYMKDPMGGGLPHNSERKERLVQLLKRNENSMVFIGYENAIPICFSTCFTTLSTFRVAPVLNIHDFFVTSSSRGKGFSKLLMTTIADKAKEIGCCKITLEVREDNDVAQNLYRAFDFNQESVNMLFWAKYSI